MTLSKVTYIANDARRNVTLDAVRPSDVASSVALNRIKTVLA
jgi:hypothetical protein